MSVEEITSLDRWLRFTTLEPRLFDCGDGGTELPVYVDGQPKPGWVQSVWVWFVAGRQIVSAWEWEKGDEAACEAGRRKALDELFLFVRAKLGVEENAESSPASVPEAGSIPPPVKL